MSREWVAAGDPDEEKGRSGTPLAPSAGRRLFVGRPRRRRHGERPLAPELFGIGDENRVLARIDLEDELNLRALVDRLELGAVLLFGQLIVYGLSTDLPVTAQVGVAVLVVVLLDVLDRKLLARYLE